MSLRSWLRKWRPNPLDQILERAKRKAHQRFLIFWNRGLGDIALGLYALVHHIRSEIPDAEITFLTRPDLRDGFVLLGGVEIIVAPNLKRGDQVAINTLTDLARFDVVIEKPDPTQWVKWQLGQLTPELNWQEKWDTLCDKYRLDSKKRYVGAHVQTETSYAHWRNWPLSSWQQLFETCVANKREVLLFGFSNHPPLNMEGVTDLRGQTSLFELLSIIKNRCEAIVVPDSGISSMVYYLKTEFPIKHISLWADPNMGILKQNVASPNPKLEHIPLLGRDKDVATITAEEVYERLC